MNTQIERRLAGPTMTAKETKLVGHAALWNTPAKIGTFSERIAPGAFQRSLATNPDILAVVNHDMGRVLGRTKSGTLRLKEDAVGLAFEIDAPDTQEGRDSLELARRGDLGGMSFGFRVAPGGERWNAARTERVLTEIALVEVSLVTHFPAYEGTTVAARNANGGRSDLARRVALIELGRAR
ncbi:HK97 family phage prohead protease [Hyphomonas sp.]|uniref:HK97 family phage prohead protease n=1 Tax=Hyphomonas sp. TaxID=87 RepID=UPI003918D797